jgi:S-DNA-T family DNA segregation ATPase FtsK/SpoIIIE
VAKAGRKNDASELFAEHFYKRLREGILIFITAIAVFIMIALVTYHSTDPGWSNLGNTEEVGNAEGSVGAWLADVLLYMCGYLAYLLPTGLFLGTWRVCRESADRRAAYHYPLLGLRFLGALLAICGSAGLLSLHFHGVPTWVPFASGGVLGNVVGFHLATILKGIGSSLVLFVGTLVGVTLLTGLSWLRVADIVGAKTLALWGLFTLRLQQRRENALLNQEDTDTPAVAKRESRRTKERQEPELRTISKAKPEIVRMEPKITGLTGTSTPVTAAASVAGPIDHANIETAQILIERAPIAPPAKAPIINKPKAEKINYDIKLAGTLPPLDLLDPPDNHDRKGYSNQQLEEMSRLVELRLQDFGVLVKVVAVHPGPVVTRYELQLAAGTKVSKITGLAKDLARALSVTSVLIVEVIPGKSVIGLELPNATREIVRLREILASQRYAQAKSPLALGIGKDIAGHAVVLDLAKMPHLLVAGTTGSGKSVGLNAMLLSLLYKSTPKELRMIMIDPKMLELSIYDGIPHLLTPVVTDMKDAANALRWCVAEMERRYRLMAALGVRNLAGYNQKVAKAVADGEPIYDPLWLPTSSTDKPTYLEELPYIVVLADEFADMMMVVGKKVEELITRIAQKARAAGIHLILATQRPSVDVITGLIKANIPTRIAFQVSSRIDSRTILDQSGAEQLLGHGDMLYLPPGTAVPVRVHGAFVADDEVHRVVSDLKRRGQAEYLEDVLSGGGLAEGGENGGNGSDTDDGEQDPVYDQAVQIVLESRRASISSVQRRLKIGFNRAARLIESMEAAGIVGPVENGSREVLVPAPIED